MTVYAYCLATSDVDAKLALLSAAQEVITEEVNCSTPAMSRPAFKALLVRLVEDDTLIVPTLSDCSSDPLDLFNLISYFLEHKCKLVILELSDSDITSSPELLKFITAFSEQQHQSIIERLKKTL